MTGAKFDIEKFDGTGDFKLYRIKMRALLIQHGCEVALKVLPTDMEAQTKAELNKKAHSAVILCLGNKVLREVTRETTTAGVCSKLETFVHTKSLANKVKFEDEYLALLLLTSLPASYEHFVDTLLYGREALTLEDVMATLNLKKSNESLRRMGMMVKVIYEGRKLIVGIQSVKVKFEDRESRVEELKSYIFQSEESH
ncbi:hypothetical protein Tco_0577000 [Tanacetum coccineum]